MTNPTLITQDTPWRGMTFDQLEERVMAAFGLTNDTTTGRTPATAGEVVAAGTHIKRAFDLLAAEFPSLWNMRTYEVAWTSGDHTIALPSNVMAILSVTLGGNKLRPISRDDYQRLLRTDEAGGDLGASSKPLYYRIAGHADGGAAGEDWRLALRLHPQPGSGYDTLTLAVDYQALAHGYADETDVIALYPFMQGWVLERAKELWAAEMGNSALMGTAREERREHAASIAAWVERGTRETSHARMTWRYPNVTRRRRY